MLPTIVLYRAVTRLVKISLLGINKTLIVVVITRDIVFKNDLRNYPI